MKKDLALNNLIVALALLLIPHLAFAHARLVIPVPRDLNAGNKSGPCGLTAKPAAAMHTFAPGQVIPIQITETIDHPGKYLVNFSAVGQTDFAQYQLAVIPDVQGQPLPHTYNATITLPNITCETCTLQMIQSMEENPANPTFYYSCADVRLAVGGAPPPVDPPVGASDVVIMEQTKPAFGGCASVASVIAGSSGGNKNGPSGGLMAIVFALPLLLLAYMRRNAYVFVKRSRITFSR